MAGDWIKMRNDLADDPAVIAIAAAVALDEFAVVGRLHTFWAWADEQSRDGHAVGVTSAWLDRKVQRDGFANALVNVGWLKTGKGGLALPNFDHHNGKTAKVRALGTRRKQSQRGAETVPPLVTQASRSERDKSETREEKRREEKKEKHPQPPPGGVSRFPPGFETFWAAYPKKVGKDAAAKAFTRRKFDGATLTAVIAAVERQKASETWGREGGRFIPNPSTWLNEGRWQDEDGHVEQYRGRAI